MTEARPAHGRAQANRIGRVFLRRPDGIQFEPEGGEDVRENLERACTKIGGREKRRETDIENQ
jgi:hypothetical protein